MTLGRWWARLRTVKTGNERTRVDRERRLSKGRSADASATSTAPLMMTPKHLHIAGHLLSQNMRWSLFADAEEEMLEDIADTAHLTHEQRRALHELSLRVAVIEMKKRKRRAEVLEGAAPEPAT
jgi:hypothetical protein